MSVITNWVSSGRRVFCADGSDARLLSHALNRAQGENNLGLGAESVVEVLDKLLQDNGPVPAA